MACMAHLGFPCAWRTRWLHARSRALTMCLTDTCVTCVGDKQSTPRLILTVAIDVRATLRRVPFAAIFSGSCNCCVVVASFGCVSIMPVDVGAPDSAAMMTKVHIFPPLQLTGSVAPYNLVQHWHKGSCHYQLFCPILSQPARHPNMVVLPLPVW